MKTDLRIIFRRLIKKILKIKSPSESWWQNWSDIDLDLFIQCCKDAGAIITPGTGKVFVSGKELKSMSELFDYEAPKGIIFPNLDNCIDMREWIRFETEGKPFTKCPYCWHQFPQVVNQKWCPICDRAVILTKGMPYQVYIPKNEKDAAYVRESRMIYHLLYDAT